MVADAEPLYELSGETGKIEIAAVDVKTLDLIKCVSEFFGKSVESLADTFAVDVDPEAVIIGCVEFIDI